jgi:hypothetical protein
MQQRSIAAGLYATGWIIVASWAWTALTPCGRGAVAADVKQVDWEQAVADYHAMEQVIRDGTRWHQAKRTAAEISQRSEWLLAQFPGTGLAAQIEAGKVVQLFHDKKYDELWPAMHAFFAKYPLFTDSHDVVLATASRVISANDVTAADRLNAFEQLGPAFANRALLFARCSRALKKVDLPQTQKYDAVLKGAERCGNYPQVREAVWQALRYSAKELGSERFVQECRMLADKYGTQCTQGREAHKIVLQAAAKPGNSASEELAKLNSEDQKFAATISTSFADASVALTEFRDEDAHAALKPLSQVPPYLTEFAWTAFLRSPVFSNLTLTRSLPVLQLLADQHVEGEPLELAMSHLRRMKSDGMAHPVYVQLASRFIVDCEKSCNTLELAVRTLNGSTLRVEPLLEAYRVGAKVAEQLNAQDRRVKFLIGLGKFGWDISPQEAREALRTAAVYYPAIPEAAEAGWMLAALEGTMNVEQNALPRPRVASDAAAVRPELKLPPAPTANSGTITADGKISLATLDPKKNLLADAKPIASSQAEGTVLACDNKKETAWQPTKLPASLIIPLNQESSVAVVRVAADSSMYYTVSLLDRQGKTLTRVERDWAFWDFYRRDKYWPQADELLKVLPTAGVAFVRLDVYNASQQNVRVNTVEAYSTSIEAQGTHLSDPVKLTGNSRSVRVNWQADEPQRVVHYDGAGEWARGFPIVRWQYFWNRLARPTRLRWMGGTMAISFFGTNAKVTLRKAGALHWQFDNGPSTFLSHPEVEPIEHALAAEITPGLHVLKLQNAEILRTEGQEGQMPQTAEVVNVSVDGKSRVRIALRFGTADNKWGAWSSPLETPGKAVAVPPQVNGNKPTLVQAGAFFDAREVRAEQSATLHKLEVIADAGTAATSPLTTASAEHTPLKENLSAVIDLVKRRKPVVAYSKLGTQAEYDVARRLAEKAGLYLVSDDIWLNNSPGPVLAVGTPHRNRLNRQLLALCSLWNVPDFFADADGVVTAVNNGEKQLSFACSTGETPEAVVRATERLIDAIPAYQTPAAPLRTFATNPLDELFAWQLNGDQPAVKELKVRMAINDRRSASLGLAADKQVKKLSVSITQPATAEGAKLPKPLIRRIGYYEWIPFFGDLRLPNLLVEGSSFAMPAKTGGGLWLTTITPADTKPGTYRAEVTLDADGQVTRVPLEIKVEPVKLTPQTKAATYSFAYLPHWYHIGSPAFEPALHALAANEASHGATHVGPPLAFDWKVEPKINPHRVASAAVDTTPDNLTWHAYSETSKTTAANSACFMAFRESVTAREIWAVIHQGVKGKFILSTWNGSSWMPLEAKPLLGDRMASCLNWKLPTGRVQYLRLTCDDGSGFSVDHIHGFTDTKRTTPITFDFTVLDLQMDIFDEEYKKLGLKPNFILQTSTYLTSAAHELSDVSHYYYGGLAPLFAEQVREHLKQKGRFERTLFKIADEPAVMKSWIEMARDFKAAGLRTMTCHTANHADLADAVGVMNPWCPYYGTSGNTELFESRRKAGDDIWWYSFGPPNMRMTGQRTENIVFYWVTAGMNYTGVMNYAALHCFDFAAPVPFRYEAGQDHRMVFFPDGSLVDTPRRELEAEGIHDLKVIEFVRTGADKLAKQYPSRAREIHNELNKTIWRVAPYKFGYSIDPQAWRNARDAVYNLAVRVVAATSAQ